MISMACEADLSSSIDTMYAYLVLSAVMRLIANCASAWANHKAVFSVQNGGSLTKSADVRAISRASSMAFWTCCGVAMVDGVVFLKSGLTNVGTLPEFPTKRKSGNKSTSQKIKWCD